MAPGSKHKQEDWGSNPTNAHKCQVGGGQTQETPRASQPEQNWTHERWVWLGVPTSENKVKGDQGRLPTFFMRLYIYVHMCLSHTHMWTYRHTNHTYKHTNMEKGRKKDRPKCSTAVNNYLLIFWSKTLVWKLTTFNSNVLCAWALNLRADFSAARVLSIPFLAKHSF